MTTETDVKQRLAALYATLAKATKACPGKALHPEGFGIHSDCCEHGCQGTGEVARFPEFRRECSKCVPGFCKSLLEVGALCHCTTFANECCNGLGWQVRGGGMEDALAGLSPKQMKDWLFLFMTWLEDCWKTDYSMPDRDTLLAKTLGLVYEVTGREVP